MAVVVAVRWLHPGSEFRIGVISGQAVTGQNPTLSALVQKRTNAGAIGLSVKCHKQKSKGDEATGLDMNEPPASCAGGCWTVKA